MRISPLGDSALLIHISEELAAQPEETLGQVLAAHAALTDAKLPGVIDLAPAYTTIAVYFDPLAIGLEELSRKIEAALASPRTSEAAELRTMEIPVCYEAEFAPDLAEVAQRTGLPEAEVIARHSGADYCVHCLGFTPGFPYMSGLPAELATPRRTSPRKLIPAGSVGIGGAQTGIYPLASPGGWQLIGRTPLRLFDAAANPPTVLRAGDRVKFRAISKAEYDGLATP